MSARAPLRNALRLWRIWRRIRGPRGRSRMLAPPLTDAFSASDLCPQRSTEVSKQHGAMRDQGSMSHAPLSGLPAATPGGPFSAGTASIAPLCREATLRRWAWAARTPCSSSWRMYRRRSPEDANPSTPPPSVATRKIAPSCRRTCCAKQPARSRSGCLSAAGRHALRPPGPKSRLSRPARTTPSGPWQRPRNRSATTSCWRPTVATTSASARPAAPSATMRSSAKKARFASPCSARLPRVRVHCNPRAARRA